MAVLLTRKNHTTWWKQEEARSDVEIAKALYKKIGEQKSCDAITQLFYFIKKHRLNKPENCTDSEVLKNLSYYLNVTLINLNRIKNLKLKVDSEKLLYEKSRATKVVIPVVEKIFDLVLEDEQEDVQG